MQNSINVNEYNQAIDEWNDEYNRQRRELLGNDGHIDFLYMSEMNLRGK